MTEKDEEALRYLVFLKDSRERIVGVREVTKALKSDKVEVVFVAEDVEEKLVSEIVLMCKQKGIRLVKAVSKDELGQACRIDVSAAAAALINE